MKMAPFELHRPETLDEALDLLARYGAEAKVLAGGQSLVPMLAMRLATPAHVIDIGRVGGLGAIEEAPDGGVVVGATVRHADAERSPLVADCTPLLARALPWIGHRAIRNRGTVCGSLAHADPAAELPAVAVATDAVLVLRSARGVREVPAAEFFTGYLSTAADDDELLVAVRFPAHAAAGHAVIELSRRHGDFALAGVVCGLEPSAGGAVGRARLALFGVADTPVRATAAEALLAGAPPTPDTWAAAADAVRAAVRPSADVHASADYRRHIAGVLAARALAAAAAAAGLAGEAAA